MTDISSIDALTNNIKTLQDISSDNANSEYMTKSMFLAVDFDGVKDSYSLKCGGSTKDCRSNDALVIVDSDKQYFIFIEFKNGQVSNAEIERIRSKIAESLLIFNDMLDVNLSFDRAHVNYILVYNQSKNPKFEGQRKASSLAKMAGILGAYSKLDYLVNGFGHYRLFFNKVQTLNETEFKEITDALENKTYSF